MFNVLVVCFIRCRKILKKQNNSQFIVEKIYLERNVSIKTLIPYADHEKPTTFCKDKSLSD